MTLKEISADYERAASLLRRRLHLLRAALRRCRDAEERWQLEHRIMILTEMLRQMNELAELTAHYYERGYTRNAKYTL